MWERTTQQGAPAEQVPSDRAAPAPCALGKGQKRRPTTDRQKATSALLARRLSAQRKAWGSPRTHQDRLCSHPAPRRRKCGNERSHGRRWGVEKNPAAARPGTRRGQTRSFPAWQNPVRSADGGASCRPHLKVAVQEREGPVSQLAAALGGGAAGIGETTKRPFPESPRRPPHTF